MKRTFSLGRLKRIYNRRLGYRITFIRVYYYPGMTLPILRTVYQWAAKGIQRTYPFKKGVYVGCTKDRHRELGIHAGINARAGEIWRNSSDDRQEVERMRDADNLRRIVEDRVIIRQFNSRWFRNRFAHLLFTD